MISILNEIRKIRNDDKLDIDLSNSNRYCVVIKEKNGTKTVYCFNTAIYSLKNGRLVLPIFRKIPKGYYYNGSNAKVYISGNLIRLTNAECSFEICFDDLDFYLDQDGFITNGNIIVIPSLNGVKIISKRKSNVKFKVQKNSNNELRTNGKYLAFTTDKFKPLVSISALYSQNSVNGECFPVYVDYQENDREYLITIHSNNDNVSFEVNMYEEKLFHDTTIESLHPDENNVLGGISFLGNTKEFGEQRLYVRYNLKLISELLDTVITSVKHYIPLLNQTNNVMSIFKADRRFCSFESTWNSKIQASEMIGETELKHNYHVLDITKTVVDETYKNLILDTTGILFVSKNGDTHVLATGDNYSNPQILEINYY